MRGSNYQLNYIFINTFSRKIIQKYQIFLMKLPLLNQIHTENPSDW